MNGNAVFLRNWPYAIARSGSAESAVKDLFDVAPLPAGAGGGASAATLGGWNIAISKYGDEQKASISFAKHLTSPEVQKWLALSQSRLPTIMSLYEDTEILRARPIVGRWKGIFLSAVPRPSAPTGVKYNEVSTLFWTAVHDTLSGKGSAARNFEELEVSLDELKGGKSW
jgi:trehalose/maltose transport system substrate-binding protein